MKTTKPTKTSVKKAAAPAKSTVKTVAKKAARKTAAPKKLTGVEAVMASSKEMSKSIQQSVSDVSTEMSERVSKSLISILPAAVSKKLGLKKSKMKKITLASGIAVLLVAGLLVGKSAMAADNTSSLESLGDQSKIIDKARPTVPANTYRVVQKRVIDRQYRSELGLTMGMVAGGGDSYYQTSNLGLQYDFHLGNRFSVGARYLQNFNELTPEGKRVYDRAEAMAGNGNTNYVVPDLDQPKSTAFATVSFYPVYGKVSWFESTVSYFDFYLMGGAGQTVLKNGSSALYTGGLGMGMWWNQYLTSRIELRYQTYNDQIYTGPRKIEGAVANFTMGLLL